jgi:hypothetical protein
MTARSSTSKLQPKAVEADLVRTRFGIVFDADADVWPIDGRQSIDVASILKLVSVELLPSLKQTMRKAAQKYAWATLIQYIYALRHLRKSLFQGGAIDRWTAADLTQYRKVLLKEFGHEDYLRHIRSLLVLWYQGRWPGVDKNLIDALKDMRLKGAEAGRAVRTEDADKGPLTELEHHALVEGLNDAAERGKLTIDQYSLAYLHVMTGRRPVQTAALKCLDLAVQPGEPDQAHPDGRPLYLLAVPRAKQRGHRFRETRRAIDLSPQHYQLFLTQKASVQNRFQAILERTQWELQTADLTRILSNLPLYPDWRLIEQAMETATQLRREGRHREALNALRRDAEQSAWHRVPDRIGQDCIKTCNAAGALSRNGSPLEVTAIRLRYSKGTGLAREGLPTTLIGWLLDHSTSRSADVYVENLPEHAAQVNNALSGSLVLQNFASAFRGKLVESEADAIGGDSPEQSRLAYRGKGAATCGHLKQCGLDGGIPRACYTCSHFQPWVDGPHEEFLEELKQDREQHAAMLGKDNAVTRRCDKTILAVHQVVEMCKQHRQAQDHSGDQVEAA